MDYEVGRFSKHCAQTGRELQPGEAFFSTLVVEDEGVVRRDYAPEAWTGAPENTLAWWKSQAPTAETQKSTRTPSETMLELFEQLQPQANQQELCYVLALLLVRRRVMRIEDSRRDEQGRETLSLYCPRRQAEFTVAAALASEERIEQIQEQLATLLAEPTS